MTDDPIPEITDLQNRVDEAELRQMEKEKQYAAELARAEQARNELRIMALSPESIRRTAKKRLLTKITLAGIAILAWVALVVVVKYLYVNF